MKGSLYLFFALILVILQMSCSEFIEPSIRNKEVVLNAPVDNYQSNRYNQSFWWEQVENARQYHLQIVSPSFDSIGFLALDTIISTNKFSFTFEPGEYQWRVKAINAGSETAFVSRRFTIFPSSLTTQQVQLIAPLGNQVSNQSNLSIKWYSLYGASKYRVEVDTNDFADEDRLVYKTLTANSEITVPLNSERTYKWRLRAENDSLQSKWSSVYTYTFDNTPPAKVSQISPDNNASTGKPVELRWNVVSGAKKYQVMVYKSTSSSPFDAGFPATVTGTSFTFNKGELGEAVQWEVRAIDEAGNIGEYSGRRSFTIQ